MVDGTLLLDRANPPHSKTGCPAAWDPSSVEADLTALTSTTHIDLKPIPTGEAAIVLRDEEGDAKQEAVKRSLEAPVGDSSLPTPEIAKGFGFESLPLLALRPQR